MLAFKYEHSDTANNSHYLPRKKTKQETDHVLISEMERRKQYIAFGQPALTNLISIRLALASFFTGLGKVTLCLPKGCFLLLNI